MRVAVLTRTHKDLKYRTAIIKRVGLLSFHLPMPSSLLVLIDDIATVLDDVALLTKVSAQKTVGVLGDDLALNAQQVAGLQADRELPVVWAVAKGSMGNKLILVPVALALSALAPWAVTPLLMLGGVYLCFEGFEKLAHLWQRHWAGESNPLSPAPKAALADSGIDAVALEKEKVRGAIRTDVVLSAEIIAITLGTVAQSPLVTQLAVLSGVAVLMTVGVYGLVAGIVKIDDAGLFLSRRLGNSLWRGAERAVGRVLLMAAPRLMRTLTVVGTAAMFLVGGGILTHGFAPLHHVVEPVLNSAISFGAAVVGVMPLLVNLLVGVLAGGVAFVLVSLVVGLWRRFRQTE